MITSATLLKSFPTFPLRCGDLGVLVRRVAYGNDEFGVNRRAIAGLARANCCRGSDTRYARTLGTFKVSLSGLCRGLCPGFCPAFCRPERASVPRSTVMTPLSRALSRDLLIGRSRCPVPTSWALSGHLSPSSSGSPTSAPPNSRPMRACAPAAAGRAPAWMFAMPAVRGTAGKLPAVLGPGTRGRPAADAAWPRTWLSTSAWPRTWLSTCVCSVRCGRC
jgi:hypothetical protein